MKVLDPAYEREGEWLLHRYELETGNVLRFAARDIRKERGRVYGTLDISLNWVSLAWSDFNLERDEERVRLANSAYSHLDDKAYDLDKQEFPKAVFKHALDLFVLGLWDEVVGAHVGGMMHGDPARSPARPILGSYVLESGGTILFGPPGAGKSYTALAWAVCTAWGIESLWPVHKAALPLYINVERSGESMAARLARVNRALGLEPETPLPFLNARGRSLGDIYEATKKTLRQEGCTWAIYDSISRAGFGSLNQDDTANRIMDMLNALTETWVALAHSPRADDTHAYGSQMFDAAADLTVQLRSQTSADGYATGVGLQVIKANDIRKPPMAVHVLEWDDGGLIGIRKGIRGEFAELESQVRRSKEEEAREYLLRVGSATARQVATEFGWARNHTSSLLNAAKWAQSHKVGREVFFSVRSEGVHA